MYEGVYICLFTLIFIVILLLLLFVASRKPMWAVMHDLNIINIYNQTRWNNVMIILLININKNIKQIGIALCILMNISMVSVQHLTSVW